MNMEKEKSQYDLIHINRDNVVSGFYVTMCNVLSYVYMFLYYTCVYAYVVLCHVYMYCVMSTWNCVTCMLCGVTYLGQEVMGLSGPWYYVFFMGGDRIASRFLIFLLIEHYLVWK